MTCLTGLDRKPSKYLHVGRFERTRNEKVKSEARCVG